ncbi:hypothetical protein AWZ03_011872 [Drosophila navojoa]|uniref:Uncharacterized protein n=1 Tax=Drosophila navojoa TaxID=7232 RepID=A0A484B1L1_DRONA|nr:hypothetical protein AWZ03_011872 [Drosophila navojoa]
MISSLRSPRCHNARPLSTPHRCGHVDSSAAETEYEHFVDKVSSNSSSSSGSGNSNNCYSNGNCSAVSA